MNLKQRWNAKCSKVGAIFHTWITFTLLFVAAISELLDYITILPADWSIPDWLKISIVIAGIITRVIGKMTVEKPKKDE